MRRYQGQALSPNPRIAVIANDALGNFVAATPLLQMLRHKFPAAHLSYFGGTRTRELQDASDLFDEGHILHGADFREVCVRALESAPHDLVINLEQQPVARAFAAVLAGPETYVVGPCFNSDSRGDLPYANDEMGRLAMDKNWLNEDTPSRFPFLKTGFISEIFCRLAYLEGPIPRYRVPSSDPGREIPDVLVATAASLPEKLWPIDKWIEVASTLVHSGKAIGLLGAPPREQGKHWKGAEDEERLLDVGVEDLRGRLTLPQVVGALQGAQAVLTIDNGILHLSAAAGTPTVGLFRHGIHRLWAPPFANLTVLIPGEDELVAEIKVETVLEAILNVL
ncbi:MAG: hypothetical protein BGO01_05630 [Armatimonadetes bacterium 55-13]|nr:glycosyltransferase family 9 protein [Armatimonadota bacterium]OJU61554.1 MAG: hypothetical protein BGO01_05630 [Armatimonadetes bacterium 55-13]